MSLPFVRPMFRMWLVLIGAPSPGLKVTMWNWYPSKQVRPRCVANQSRPLWSCTIPLMGSETSPLESSYLIVSFVSSPLVGIENRMSISRTMKGLNMSDMV